MFSGGIEKQYRAVMGWPNLLDGTLEDFGKRSCSKVFIIPGSQYNCKFSVKKLVVVELVKL